MRTSSKWLALGGIAAMSIALVHCVGDDPATNAGSSDDAGGDGSTQPPGDGSTPIVDAGPDAMAVCAANAVANNITCGAGVSPCIVQVAAGGRTFCTRDTECKVRCWGDNTDGQLGVAPSTTSFSATPLVVDLGTQLAVGLDVGGTFDPLAGQSAVCVRVTGPSGGSNTVECWGSNQFGQLGVADAGTLADDAGHAISYVPVAVPGLDNVGGLVVGALHSCALVASADGKSIASMQCWGDNNHGELGRDTVGIFDPTPAPATVTPVAFQNAVFAVGYRNTCLIKDLAGHVVCVGDNGNGQLGNDGGSDDQDASVFATIPGADWGQIALAGNAACAIGKTNSLISCWGDNDEGELGNGAATPGVGNPIPTIVPALSSTVVGGAVGGARNFCANLGTTATADGGLTAKIDCWGANMVGESFQPTDGGDLPTPMQMPLPPGRIVHLAAGAQSTCALYSDGTVWCWGQNIAGELGPGAPGSGNDLSVQPPTLMTF